MHISLLDNTMKSVSIIEHYKKKKSFKADCKVNHLDSDCSSGDHSFYDI